MYRLIMKSKLPSAEKFEEWVCNEVLPTIRKTGVYVSNEDLFINILLTSLYGQTMKGCDSMSPLKKGQKLTDNPKSIRLEIRLTQSEAEILKECAERMNTTKTKVITEGINLVRNSFEKSKR